VLMMSYWRAPAKIATGSAVNSGSFGSIGATLAKS
jgi:hypothetical protein